MIWTIFHELRFSDIERIQMTLPVKKNQINQRTQQARRNVSVHKNYKLSKMAEEEPRKTDSFNIWRYFFKNKWAE